ncbi:unnamed protein product [Eruca vesicaria subsp. sativa]|uniref:Encoded peptide n=1 Tax=Eruca vesicaria subsp. sativa TaxID=29727 RepID=A0ABC8JKQ1_ERUVS|nr:unnamed protein product [Eruca vesicaria subsp. sativa]
MAKSAFLKFYKSVLIITIILCHEILPTEARHLRTHRKPIKNRTTSPTTHGASGGDLSTTAVSSVKKSGISEEEEHGVDEFRPTTPGNSPGIGHSTKT